MLVVPTVNNALQQLNDLFLQNKYKTLSMNKLFAHDKQRFDKYSQAIGSVFIDYSKNIIDDKALNALIRFADSCQLTEAIDNLMTGKMVNHSEQRAALHTALRDQSDKVQPEIRQALQQMQQITQNSQSITDVIHLGVGGSELGPKLLYQALQKYQHNNIHFHFVAYENMATLKARLNTLNPKTTLVIAVSKSFSTAETMRMADIAKQWLQQNNADCFNKHFFAVTANTPKAAAFGVIAQNILPLWEWVGGRYSIWSAVGLSVMLAIGADNFKAFLQGAYAIDQHFQHTDLSNNLPVKLALISFWYGNYFAINNKAIIPYTSLLSKFPDYLQQLFMESLGKSVNQQGEAIDYSTGPIIWGNVAPNCQHSFLQLLLQGKQSVAIDFILPLKESDNFIKANCLGESQALMQGLQAESSYKSIRGNVPSNTILLNQLSPETLGALIALYEHQVYVLSVLWNINAFDQWGVEYGKKLAKNIEQDLTAGRVDDNNDGSTQGLMRRVEKL